MLNRLFLAAVATAAISFPAVAQEKGIEILEKTAATLKDLKSLKFKSQLTNSPGTVTAAIKTDIDVTLLRNEAGQWTSRYSGSATGLGPAGDESGDLKVDVYDDGTATTWVDYPAEKVHIRRSRIAKGPAIQMAKYGTQILDDLLADAPFAEAIGNGQISVEGEETLDGTVCDRVRILNESTSITQHWAIARSDNLPRRLITEIPNMGETSIVLSNVVVNAEVGPQDMEVIPPPNFEVVDRGPNRVAVDQERPGMDAGPAPRKRGVEVGNEVPDFELAKTGGENIRLRNLRPDVVVINFWGSWCLPCSDVNDQLQALHEDYKDKGVRVLSLAAKEADPANAVAMAEQNGWTYDLLLDADNTARLYQIRRYPTILVVGREGEVLYSMKGYKAEDEPFAEIRKVIDEALSKPAEAPAPEGEQPAGANPGGERRPAGTTTTGDGRSTSGGG